MNLNRIIVIAPGGEIIYTLWEINAGEEFYFMQRRVLVRFL